jgi:hypothetical protein
MSSDMVKGMAVQGSFQQPYSQRDESGIDQILQSLMLDDTDVKRILKGNIQEPLNKLQQLTIQCFQMQQIDKEQGYKIIELLKDINGQMKHYKRMIPYLLLLSPLMKLSNISEKEAASLRRRVGIIIMRDRLDQEDEEDALQEANWFDSIEMLVNAGINCSINGWMIKQIAEERKTVNTVIQDSTLQRKRKFGVF